MEAHRNQAYGSPWRGKLSVPAPLSLARCRLRHQDCPEALGWDLVAKDTKVIRSVCGYVHLRSKRVIRSLSSRVSESIPEVEVIYRSSPTARAAINELSVGRPATY